MRGQEEPRPMEPLELMERLLDDPSFLETIKEFCEGQLTPMSFYHQVETATLNIKEACSEHQEAS
jgi:TusA-related sulfurtransferase